MCNVEDKTDSVGIMSHGVMFDARVSSCKVAAFLYGHFLSLLH